MDGRIDWAAVWRTALERHRASSGFAGPDTLWKGRGAARRYDGSERMSERVDLSLSALPLRAGDAVLDIGAGRGTLTLPIARLVDRVDAVEPSGGMAAVLRERVAAAGLRNIGVVEKRFEDLDPLRDLAPPYDIVVASFSLAMPDLAAALLKMEEVASGSVHIFWHAGTPAWERQYLALWPALHAAPYRPVPKAEVVFNLLWEMERYPNLTVHRFTEERRFSGMEDALAYYAPRYSAKDERQVGVLTAALEEWLNEEDGDLVMRERSRFAHIWWEKEGG
ncbi:class I SAM-dependent methyltransferase [Methanofollis fontis]|uniref:Class I SAM-dependent methyltransferase n=1 Tax=Methanofollis fontis TaxID=2052832 RepID=A0A483CVL0_9EURY|nr:class I SAM-dependent methyltransferase [Methanofollis fontis]TAJ45547.1 class I SAM-dependent methyltransferase [Methanofollis fontis]